MNEGLRVDARSIDGVVVVGLKLAYLQQEKLVTSLSCLARLFHKQSRKERAATTLWGRQSRLLLMGTDCSEKLPPSS